MNEYDDATPMPGEPEPDPRVLGMQRVVDLEQRNYTAMRSAKDAAERAEKVRSELFEARAELHKMLGVSANDGAVQAMSRDEAKRIAAERYAR